MIMGIASIHNIAVFLVQVVSTTKVKASYFSDFNMKMQKGWSFSKSLDDKVNSSATPDT